MLPCPLQASGRMQAGMCVLATLQQEVSAAG